ncbi:acyl transferase/acyl hydrolase/lysophospholipase [Chytridium lagenaria]|nr:acyl transferase/acyl hydrolase/lysophospholipase [Chytridium lagenaria]
MTMTTATGSSNRQSIVSSLKRDHPLWTVKEVRSQVIQSDDGEGTHAQVADSKLRRRISKRQKYRKKLSSANLKVDLGMSEMDASVHSHDTGESLDSMSSRHHFSSSHKATSSNGSKKTGPSSIQSVNTSHGSMSSDDALLSAGSSSDSGSEDPYDSFDDFQPDAKNRLPTLPGKEIRNSTVCFTFADKGSSGEVGQFGANSKICTAWKKVYCLYHLALSSPFKFLVFLWETLFTWRGLRRKLRNFMSSAKDYDEWKEAAKNLDMYLNHDPWKTEIESDLYNSKLIQKTTRRLRRHRVMNDPDEVRRLLTHACKRIMGDVQTRVFMPIAITGLKCGGTVLGRGGQSLWDFLADTPTLSLQDKKEFFKNTARNYGRSVLCLSGGAGFAYYHMGVMKALFDRGVLPEVITGTSAGSLMAALVCTRTDEEIVEDGIFEKRWYATGAMFDSEDGFERMGVATKGHMTFMEAYKKTGRILCITVVPDERGPMSPPKVLNFLTAPDVLISSAIVASSAVPGVLLPSRLLCKTVTGEFVPWHGSGKRWRDGSIRTDIPDLPWLNIGFTIVSQVNPHISIFFYESQGSAGCPTAHRSGRGWRGGFLASTLVHHLDLDLKKWLRLTKDLRLLPPIASTDISSLWLQQFEGSTTILPAGDHRILDWFQILDDPTRNVCNCVLTAVRCGRGRKCILYGIG